MANYASVASCIRQEFDTRWTALDNGVPHYFEDQEVSLDTLENSEWVRLSIQFGNSQQVSMGGGTTGRRVRTTGQASVQIFVPNGTGDGRIYTLSDAIASLWQVSTIQGIIFRASSTLPPERDGPWVNVPVFTPFQADEFVG